jgi:hypothetical protein
MAGLLIFPQKAFLLAAVPANLALFGIAHHPGSGFAGSL